jgi:hypothetical protein
MGIPNCPDLEVIPAGHFVAKKSRNPALIKAPIPTPFTITYCLHLLLEFVD